MSSDKYKDEFEQFITDEANKHKMFASDAVWANIAKQIQPEKPWPALTIISFSIVVLLSIITFLNYPPDNFLAKSHYQDSVQLVAKNTEQAIVKSRVKGDNLERRISAVSITTKTFDDIEHAAIDDALTVANVEEDSNASVSKIVPTAVTKLAVAANDNSKKPIVINAKALSQHIALIDVNTISIANNKIEVAETDSSLLAKADEEKKSLDGKDAIEENKKNATDDFLKKLYAATKHRKPISNSKWSYEIYATPSVSYRKLEDDKERDQFVNTAATAPLAQNLTTSVNNVVRHKPALGLEFGTSIMYNVTKRFKVKVGLQFNMRQYFIDAYQSSGIATIAIVQNNRLDSVNVYTRFGNGNGYSSAKLDNKLYQVSIPIGIQWDVLQGRHLGVSAGASVQPTFTLNKNIYLISTDYKYYANGESFFRKFNVNTSFDLNFSYKFRDSKIYLGPQIRYQHLPTYTDAYPIKEYRWDYGVKIGFIKSF